MALSLPASLQQIADIAGIDTAITIALEVGGGRLHIPRRAEGTRLAGLVGLDAAQALVAAFGEIRLEIPTARRAMAHHLIDRLGWSIDAAAQRLRTTRRSIYRWRAEGWRDSDTEPTDLRQWDLFGTG